MALTKVSRGLLSTGIVDNSNATAITIDSSENVGIGTGSPDSYYSKELVVAHGTEGGITLVGAAGTATGYLMFADVTTGNESYRGYIGYSHSTPDVMVFGTAGSEVLRIDSSGNLLVGTTTAGTKTGDGVIAFGAGGGVMGNFSSSLANNGTLDIAINTSGGGYQGFLSVANTVAANAAVRTQSTFSVFGRSTDSSIQQIATDTGTTGAATFTVTTPSNGVIRVTNTSGSTTVASMQFFGGTSG